MKVPDKYISISLVLLFIGSSLDAQKIKYGLQGGIVRANTHLIFEPEVEDSKRTSIPIISYSFNIYAGYFSDGIWAIGIEPGFIQKGELLKYKPDDPSHDVRINLNYIQFPISARIHFFKSAFFSVGPEIAYLINVKTRSNNDNTDISEHYDRKYEISGFVGLGYTFFDNIEIEFRYAHGITYKIKMPYLLSASNNEPGGEVKMYNEYIQFIARFKL